MKTVTNPKVKLLATGEQFNVKQMEAKKGDLLPKHLATIESVLIVIQGKCVLTIAGIDHNLEAGDSFIVPPKIKHQIRAVEDLKAFHVMTNDIAFEFFS